MAFQSLKVSGKVKSYTTKFTNNNIQINLEEKKIKY